MCKNTSVRPRLASCIGSNPGIEELCSRSKCITVLLKYLPSDLALEKRGYGSSRAARSLANDVGKRLFLFICYTSQCPVHVAQWHGQRLAA
jgi:hypothetical protein